MDPAQWHKIEEIYHQASKKPPGERTKFIDESCGGNGALKDEVHALLHAQDSVGDFMASPPLKDEMHLETATSIIEREELALIGKIIGAYYIERVIASGGMGTVYLARRTDEAFQQKVAIKLIRGGLQSREILRRFYRERQILANLNHVNIARLLDGGTSEDGHPYLIMEYIKGTTIDEYCDHRRLTVSERLALFQKVCSAVQYAHGKLVVHRDIKPRNILVTDEGEPKLLDFGIVKLLDPEDELAGTLTLTVQRLMTPEYASPEQMRGENISTASDIYSLGIVLYELLTGHRPFRFQTTSAKEVERIVCEEDPPRPSTAISQTTEIAIAGGETKRLTPDIVSETREGKPERLRRRLRGDLDQVVMKALRKEPEQRYASVEHFSLDIRRHLQGLPVYARRGTWKYRSQKYLKRNKAAMLALLALLVLLSVPAYLMIQNARQAAHKETADRVLGVLKDLYNKPFSNKTPRDEIQQAVENDHTQQLIDHLQDQPEELIRYADTIAQVCESFHLYDLAVKWRGISLECQSQSGQAKACFLHAQTLLKAGRFEEAQKQAEEANALLARYPQEREVPTGALKHLLAKIQWNLGVHEEARDLFDRSLQSLRGEKGLEQAILIDVLVDYADYLVEYGYPDEALKRLEEALHTCNSITGDRQSLLNAKVHQHLGRFLWFTSRFMDAEPYLRQAYETFQRLLPESDPRVVSCMSDLAALLHFSRKHDEDFSSQIAYAYCRRVKRILEETYGADSLEVSKTLLMISKTVIDGTAQNMMNRVSTDYRKYWPENHPRIIEVDGYMGASLAGARSPLKEGYNLDQGEDLLRGAIEALSCCCSPSHWKIGQFKIYLAIILIKQERLDEAKALIEEGFGLWKRTLGNQHPHFGAMLKRLAQIYGYLGHAGEESKYRNLAEENTTQWPYYYALYDCDFTMEKTVRIDFEDDQIEKILAVDVETTQFTGARLWIYGHAQNYPWQNFRDYENIRIRVNQDHEKEISFNVALKFGDITEYLQWIPFEIPIDWIVAGDNYFTFYIAHEKGFKESRPWEFNNLYIAVDSDHDYDRSWWFGGFSYTTCCREMDLAAIHAPKPLSRDASIITEHRKKGYKECEGELMVLLELH